MATVDYVCPDCKSPLANFYCRSCKVGFRSVDGIARLLPNDPWLERGARIADAYDSIYAYSSNVWENQGRTPEFICYFSSLLGRFPSQRLLEIGCGEGFLLAALNHGEKFAIDVSSQALRRARARARAHFSVALVERLPFPDDYFGLIAAVGVMEHFLDIQEALREIHRVLKPGGHYVALVHVHLTLRERLALKVAEFIVPRPRPLALARWVTNRLRNAVRSERQGFVTQPIQNRYTTWSGKRWLERSSFRVIDAIHTRKYPRLPLEGPWVVIYVGQK